MTLKALKRAKLYYAGALQKIGDLDQRMRGVESSTKGTDSNIHRF